MNYTCHSLIYCTDLFSQIKMWDRQLARANQSSMQLELITTPARLMTLAVVLQDCTYSTKARQTAMVYCVTQELVEKGSRVYQTLTQGLRSSDLREIKPENQ